MPKREIISIGLFARLLAIRTDPCSVPTRNLLGPASTRYSIEVPPIYRSIFFSPSMYMSMMFKVSMGPCENFL